MQFARCVLPRPPSFARLTVGIGGFFHRRRPIREDALCKIGGNVKRPQYARLLDVALFVFAHIDQWIGWGRQSMCRVISGRVCRVRHIQIWEVRQYRIAQCQCSRVGPVPRVLLNTTAPCSMVGFAPKGIPAMPARSPTAVLGEVQIASPTFARSSQIEEGSAALASLFETAGAVGTLL